MGVYELHGVGPESVKKALMKQCHVDWFFSGCTRHHVCVDISLEHEHTRLFLYVFIGFSDWTSCYDSNIHKPLVVHRATTNMTITLEPFFSPSVSSHFYCRCLCYCCGEQLFGKDMQCLIEASGTFPMNCSSDYHKLHPAVRRKLLIRGGKPFTPHGLWLIYSFKVIFT